MRRYILMAMVLLSTTLATAQERGFNLIVVGDPQPQTEEQLTRLECEIVPRIATIVEEYRATGYPTALLLTGDVVWDTMEFLPRVKAMFEALGVPVYAVIGNHDHPADVVDNEPLAQVCYEAVFGPRNYTVQLGDSHLFALDNIVYTDHDNYHIDIDKGQLRWLKRELRKIAPDNRVVIAMHAPVVDYRGGGSLLKYARPIIRLAKGHEIDFVTGHRHRHATADIAPDIVEHSVAQVNGNLWFAPICSDGTPQGVFCIEERDGNWQWHHRMLGHNANKQMVVWPTGRVNENEDYVVVKIIGWDDRWRVEWMEDGTPRGAMEQIEIVDPDYIYYVENEATYDETIMARLRRSAYPHKHYFRCRPAPSTKLLTIRATDRFGRHFEEVIHLD